MKKVIFIIFMILSLARIAGALEITFKTNCSVDDSVIRLGDVAGFDEETPMSRALASQIVGQAPAPGEKISLHSLEVKEFLVSSQSLPQNIRWMGSPNVTVLRLGETIGPERIKSIIAEYLKRNQNNLPEAEIRFIPSALPLPFTLPTGELSQEVIPSNPAILGSSRISIIFRVDGKVVKNMSVRGNIEALANVVISAGPLRRGAILSPRDLTTRVMDIGSMDNPGLDEKDLIGKKLQRSLRAGSPVLPSMVESLPVVRRGERVKMVINSGALHLTATGLAHSDGALDQMIRVQNISSNKTVYCRVAAPGIVEVML